MDFLAIVLAIFCLGGIVGAVISYLSLIEWPEEVMIPALKMSPSSNKSYKLGRNSKVPSNHKKIKLRLSLGVCHRKPRVLHYIHYNSFLNRLNKFNYVLITYLVLLRVQMLPCQLLASSAGF